MRKDKYVFAILKNACKKNPLFVKTVRNMKYTNQAVTKFWAILNEYIETNKIINEVEFSKSGKW